MKINKFLLVALIIGISFHGAMLFFTLEKTYDALIHMFFAEHYANSWFEPWNFKWYTGFTVTSYPPLVHQLIGLLSFIGGLKFGLFTVAFLSIILFTTGVYRFSYLITNSKVIAGYACVFGILSTTFIETLHLFGQLPSIIGISLLLHALPEIYKWILNGTKWNLTKSISLIAITVTSHHVTPIFGMVFFIFPLIGMAILDHAKLTSSGYKEISLKVFLRSFKKLFLRIVGFGFTSLIFIVGCILPYWINTKNNPITQVPIPHGSRDNFIEVTSSGLVFFLIPWGILLFVLPYIFYRFYTKRYIFFGLSITLLFVLGTGDTTPIPKMMLGETAFNILTLDRFTLWASIMALPIFGEFGYRIIEGDFRSILIEKFGHIYHKILVGGLIAFMLFGIVFTVSLGYFRPSQPKKIDMLPIVNFLNQDQHYKWRYLTLGFGDQMAYLASQTKALTVDGNYHSARRLPELTTRAIERLENSKFKGVEGIGSLQQFLTIPDKYNLKYIFSNDKFYDPILYFCGWDKLQLLENGIAVWEKNGVPPLSSILPKDEISQWQKIVWGIVPLSTLAVAVLINLRSISSRILRLKSRTSNTAEKPLNLVLSSSTFFRAQHLWAYIMLALFGIMMYSYYIFTEAQRTPQHVLNAYYDAMDFKEFESAHSYLDPNAEKSMDQFMLEISVSDGLLSSYSKLDAIYFEEIKSTSNNATYLVKTSWVTPLQNITKEEIHQLEKQDGKWYIIPKKIENDIAPNQLLTAQNIQYFNQGRRRITTEQTYHEDVLKQPVVEIIEAKLIVAKDSSYHILGQVQNLDNVPADIEITASLYDNNNVSIAKYNTKNKIKHKLLPKETSAFSIAFEGIAWIKDNENIPDTFDPDAFTPIDLEEAPVTFDLQASAQVSSTNIYKDIALNDLRILENGLEGDLFNIGTKEVTIPQLLISYYNANKELLWMQSKYVDQSLKQEKSRAFSLNWPEIGNVATLESSTAKCFVNGLPNDVIARELLPERNFAHQPEILIPVDHEVFKFIKIDINGFIGN